MPNKIAIIDHVGCKAGIDQYTSALAGALASKGLTVYVASNFTVSDLPVSWKKYFLGNEGSKYQRALNFFTGYLQSAFWCRRNKCCDVIVHVFSFALKDLIVFTLLFMLGLRVTTIVHDVEGFRGAGMSKLVQKIMLRHLSKWIIVHNRFSLQYLGVVAGAEIAARAVIIPHGHFHSLYAQMPTKAAARAELGLSPDVTYLLFFGQIKEEKGLDLIIHALPFLPSDTQLIIAGRPWKTSFESYDLLIQQLAIEHRVVKMIRFITDEERTMLFAAANLLVIPYRVIYQSGVLLMAISAGIPVVASSLPANCEIIEDGRNGYLFKSENQEALNATLQRAIANSNERIKFAAHAHGDLALTHSWEGIAERYIQMWNQNKRTDHV